MLIVLNWITANVLQHLRNVHPTHHPKERERLKAALNSTLEWLKTVPVMKWYETLAEPHQRGFGQLLLHIASESFILGARDGCYIALTYVVSAFSVSG